MPPLLTIDAFADRPFAGNPAAVCLLDAWPDERWLADVAAEMNLAETAFLVPQGDDWRLRWLTPEVEVDLCGHATLAAAHALWSTGRLAPGAPARFHTRSGLLTARQDGALIELDFPALSIDPTDAPAGLLGALGLDSAREVLRTPFDLLVVVDDEATVRALRPDHLRLAAYPVRGVIVTAPGAAPNDCVSRFFAPGSGVPEDPVTGSAHCALAPYWAARTGRTALTGYQASRRGGTVRMRLDGDRVRLAGRAFTVASGTLLA